MSCIGIMIDRMIIGICYPSGMVFPRQRGVKHSWNEQGTS
jgi:hypothetical protein